MGQENKSKDILSTNFKLRAFISQSEPYVSSALFAIVLIDYLYSNFIGRINWPFVLSDFGWVLFLILGITMIFGFMYLPVIIMVLKTKNATLSTMGSVILLITPFIAQILPSYSQLEFSSLIMCIVLLFGFWVINVKHKVQKVLRSQEEARNKRIGKIGMGLFFMSLPIIFIISLLLNSIDPLWVLTDILFLIIVISMNVGMVKDFPSIKSEDLPSLEWGDISDRKMQKLTPVEYFQILEKKRQELFRIRESMNALQTEISKCEFENDQQSIDFDNNCSKLQILLEQYSLNSKYVSKLERYHTLFIKFAFYEHELGNIEESIKWIKRLNRTPSEIKLLNLIAKNYALIGEYNKAFWMYLLLIRDINFYKVIDFENLAVVLKQNNFPEVSQYASEKNTEKLCAALKLRTYYEMKHTRKLRIISSIVGVAFIVGIITLFVVLRIYNILPVLPYV